MCKNQSVNVNEMIDKETKVIEFGKHKDVYVDGMCLYNINKIIITRILSTEDNHPFLSLDFYNDDLKIALASSNRSYTLAEHEHVVFSNI